MWDGGCDGKAVDPKDACGKKARRDRRKAMKVQRCGKDVVEKRELTMAIWSRKFATGRGAFLQTHLATLCSEMLPSSNLTQTTDEA
jgi:hypothetical protein